MAKSLLAVALGAAVASALTFEIQSGLEKVRNSELVMPQCIGDFLPKDTLAVGKYEVVGLSPGEPALVTAKVRQVDQTLRPIERCAY